MSEVLESLPDGTLIRMEPEGLCCLMQGLEGRIAAPVDAVGWLFLREIKDDKPFTVVFLPPGDAGRGLLLTACVLTDHYFQTIAQAWIQNKGRVCDEAGGFVAQGADLNKLCDAAVLAVRAALAGNPQGPRRQDWLQLMETMSIVEGDSDG